MILLFVLSIFSGHMPTIAGTISVFFICLSAFLAYNSTYQDFAQCMMRTCNSVTGGKVLTSSRPLS